MARRKIGRGIRDIVTGDRFALVWIPVGNSFSGSSRAIKTGQLKHDVSKTLATTPGALGL
eukprot:6739670-Pyramimonas_sp.AAC.1